MKKEDLFNGFDINSIADNIDFKEDSVREIILEDIGERIEGERWRLLKEKNELF